MIGKIFQLVITLLFLASSIYAQEAKKVIIIGASSGIGEALTHVFSKNNYKVGFTARRTEKLEQIQKELPNKSIIKTMDVSKTDEARKKLEELIQELGGLDIIILNAGRGEATKDLNWEKQEQAIAVNISGFTALATLAMKYFIEHKQGHLVGISSITALRGLPNAPTYSGSKAYVSNFLQGLRSHAAEKNLPIYVTDIKPGFVDTPMVAGQKNKFWEATPQEAAQQIFDAVQAKDSHAYVTKRWRLVAWLLKIIPDWLFDWVLAYQKS